MGAGHGPRSRSIRGAATALVLLVAGARLVDAAEPAPLRAGGLVPTPRKTREELVREWDLNSDGKIDPGEAEVAASRMRRERAALRLNSGIDPITGLPRDLASDVLGPDDPDAAVEPAEPAESVTEPATEEEGDRDDRPHLPGTRVPRPRLPAAGRSQAEPQASGGRPAPAGSRAAADLARQPVTGGVRAGGLPARAGYGAPLPGAPLNAGLPIAPKGAPAAVPAPRPRGGLVPAQRPAPAPRPTASRDMYDPY